LGTKECPIAGPNQAINSSKQRKSSFEDFLCDLPEWLGTAPIKRKEIKT